LPWSGTVILVQGERRGGGVEKNWLDTCVDFEGLYGKEALFVLEGSDKAFSCSDSGSTSYFMQLSVIV
jgi:hypothetical protein